ncbi:hypothetical protein Tco_1352374 [Tanacetum coccineum]
MKTSKVAGDNRVGIFGKEPFNAGVKLFYDYGYAHDQAPVWALKPDDPNEGPSALQARVKMVPFHRPRVEQSPFYSAVPCVQESAKGKLYFAMVSGNFSSLRKVKKVPKLTNRWSEKLLRYFICKDVTMCLTTDTHIVNSFTFKACLYNVGMCEIGAIGSAKGKLYFAMACKEIYHLLGFMQNNLKEGDDDIKNSDVKFVFIRGKKFKKVPKQQIVGFIQNKLKEGDDDIKSRNVKFVLIRVKEVKIGFIQNKLKEGDDDIKSRIVKFVLIRGKEVKIGFETVGRNGDGSETASPIPRSMKLDVPKFSGAIPDRWIFSITEYFTLLSTPMDQRLRVVGFNLEGYAAEFFRWMTRKKSITTWDGFLESVRNRFGPWLLISFYICGLKPAIQRVLLVSEPTSLGNAFSLARVTEARLEDQWVCGHKCPRKFLLLMTDEEDDTVQDSKEDVVESGDISTLNSLIGQGGPRIPVRQVLVQWSGRPPEEAMREWLSEFQESYLSYHLKDKVIFEREKNVMPSPREPRRSKRARSKPAWQNDYAM